MIPAVLAEADAEGDWVVTAMDRAGARETVSVLVQPRHEVVVLQNLDHGDCALDGVEVNESGFGHRETSLKNGTAGIPGSKEYSTTTEHRTANEAGDHSNNTVASLRPLTQEELELGKVNRGNRISDGRRAKYLDLLRLPLDFLQKQLPRLRVTDIERFEKALNTNQIQSRLKHKPYAVSTKIDMRKALTTIAQRQDF